MKSAKLLIVTKEEKKYFAGFLWISIVRYYYEEQKSWGTKTTKTNPKHLCTEDTVLFGL